MRAKANDLVSKDKNLNMGLLWSIALDCKPKIVTLSKLYTKNGLKLIQAWAYEHRFCLDQLVVCKL